MRLDKGTISNGRSPELRGPTQAAGMRASRPFCLNLKGQRVGMSQSKLARTES